MERSKYKFTWVSVNSCLFYHKYFFKQFWTTILYDPVTPKILKSLKRYCLIWQVNVFQLWMNKKVLCGNCAFTRLLQAVELKEDFERGLKNEWSYFFSFWNYRLNTNGFVCLNAQCAIIITLTTSVLDVVV